MKILWWFCVWNSWITGLWCWWICSNSFLLSESERGSSRTLHHSSWKTLWGSLIGWNRPCEAFFLNSQHQLFGFWTFWSSMSKFVLSLLIVLARKLWIIQRFLLFLWWKDINYNLQYFIGWETALWITKRRKKQINKEPVSHYWINLYAESATMGEVSRVRGSVDFP